MFIAGVYKDAWVDTDRNTNQMQHMVTQFRASDSGLSLLGSHF